jgi:hypothetical protein
MSRLRARWRALWVRETFPSRDHLRLALLFAVLMTVYTSNKLYCMAAVRGWVPGARSEWVTILRKEIVPGGGGLVRRLHWKDADGRDDWGNPPPERWEALAVGDTLEIRWVGLTPESHIADGIWASDGNVVFDVVLVLLELLGVGWAWRRLRLIRPDRRRSSPAPADP